MNKNSLLLQIHTLIWFNELKNSKNEYNSLSKLDEIPVTVWQTYKDLGFDALYLLGIWKVDTLTKEIFTKKGLKKELDEVLPDWHWSDTSGSPFSINEYIINPSLGDEKTLKNVHKTLNSIGLNLIVDFVPNHFGLQTPFTEKDNFFIEEQNYSDSTKDYDVIKTLKGTKAIYHGRDPYFPPWEDTFQVDFSNNETRIFMINQLLSIAEVSDGVRCDMAMLLVTRIFKQTWNKKLSGELQDEFWEEAIKTVKKIYPLFTFIAEVYWDMEQELMDQGFDFCYDKKIYDALRDRNNESLQWCLTRDKSFQEKTVRFLENHDETRAVIIFNNDIYLAAMILTYTTPGLKIFHENQLEGFATKTSLFLSRKKLEEINPKIKNYYDSLFSNIYKDILKTGTFEYKKDIQFLKNKEHLTTGLYCWQWHNNEIKVNFIVNFTNNEKIVELIPEISELTLIIHSNTFQNKKVSKQNEKNLKFAIAPYGVLVFTYS